MFPASVLRPSSKDPSSTSIPRTYRHYDHNSPAQRPNSSQTTRRKTASASGGCRHRAVRRSREHELVGYAGRQGIHRDQGRCRWEGDGEWDRFARAREEEGYMEKGVGGSCQL